MMNTVAGNKLGGSAGKYGDAHFRGNNPGTEAEAAALAVLAPVDPPKPEVVMAGACEPDKVDLTRPQSQRSDDSGLGPCGKGNFSRASSIGFPDISDLDFDIDTELDPVILPSAAPAPESPVVPETRDGLDQDREALSKIKRHIVSLRDNLTAFCAFLKSDDLRTRCHLKVINKHDGNVSKLTALIESLNTALDRELPNIKPHRDSGLRVFSPNPGESLLPMYSLGGPYTRAGLSVTVLPFNLAELKRVLGRLRPLISMNDQLKSQLEETNRLMDGLASYSPDSHECDVVFFDSETGEFVIVEQKAGQNNLRRDSLQTHFGSNPFDVTGPETGTSVFKFMGQKISVTHKVHPLEDHVNVRRLKDFVDKLSLLCQGPLLQILDKKVVVPPLFEPKDGPLSSLPTSGPISLRYLFCFGGTFTPEHKQALKSLYGQMCDIFPLLKSIRIDVAYEVPKAESDERVTDEAYGPGYGLSDSIKRAVRFPGTNLGCPLKARGTDDREPSTGYDELSPSVFDPAKMQHF